jgi:hypothetical protein
MRRKGRDSLELIDLYGNDRIRFAAMPGSTLMAYDADGRSLGKVGCNFAELRMGGIGLLREPGATPTPSRQRGFAVSARRNQAFDGIRGRIGAQRMRKL